MTAIELRAFHGTRASKVDSIVKNGIHPSRNHDDWLGAGTYFFVDGLDDPRICAFEWARCKLWNKRTKAFDEGDVAVIETIVTVDDQTLFDLREAENVRAFHRARRRWIKQRVPRGLTHLARPAEPSYDTSLLDEFKQSNEIAALISDFYIKFFVRERHFRLDSRIPNVSVLCLTHPLWGSTSTEIAQVEILQPASVLESESDDEA